MSILIIKFTENETEVSLDSPVRFKRVRLLQSTLPFTWYNVNTNNNTINIVHSDSNPYAATLTVGSYLQGHLMASAIQTALNTATSTTDYTATYDSCI